MLSRSGSFDSVRRKCATDSAQDDGEKSKNKDKDKSKSKSKNKSKSKSEKSKSEKSRSRSKGEMLPLRYAQGPVETTGFLQVLRSSAT